MLQVPPAMTQRGKPSEARAARDVLIVEAARNGHTLAEIGATHHITAAHVARVCRRAGLAVMTAASRETTTHAAAASDARLQAARQHEDSSRRREAQERAAVEAVRNGSSVTAVARSTAIAYSRLMRLTADCGFRKAERQAREARDAAIIAAVKEGRSQAAVATEHGLAPHTVWRICKAAGVVRSRAAQLAAKAARDAEIVRAIGAGLDPADVAVEHGVSRQHVRFICAMAQSGPRAPAVRVAKAQTAADLARAERNEAIVTALRAGRLVKDVAAEHGLTSTGIAAIRLKAGVKPTGLSRAERDERNAAIIAAVESGRTRLEVARSYGLDRSTISMILTAASRAPRRYRRPARELEQSKQTILAALRAGATVEHTAAHHGLSLVRVHQLARTSGVAVRTVASERREAVERSAVEQVRSGRLPREVAAESNINILRLRAMCRAAGVPLPRPPRNPALIARDAAILAAARAGASSTEVGAEFGVSGSRVQQICMAAGVLLPTHRPNPELAARNQSILETLRAGKSTAVVAAAHGVQPHTVREVGREAGLAVSKLTSERHAAVRQRAIEDLRCGRGLADVAAEHGLATADIRQLAKQVGLAIPRRRPAPRARDRDDSILNAVRDGAAPRDVSTQFGISASRVRQICRAAAVEIPRRRPHPGQSIRDGAVAHAVGEGRPVREVAAEHGISVARAQQIAAATGVKSPCAAAIAAGRLKLAENPGDPVAEALLSKLCATEGVARVALRGARGSYALAQLRLVAINVLRERGLRVDHIASAIGRSPGLVRDSGRTHRERLASDVDYARLWCRVRQMLEAI